MKLPRAIYIFICGLLSGIFIEHGFSVLERRVSGRFGGEVLIMPLIFLLILMGIQIGLTFSKYRSQQKVIRFKYRYGCPIDCSAKKDKDTKWPNEHNQQRGEL